MLRIGLVGASGKFGQAIGRAAATSSDCQITAALGRQDRMSAHAAKADLWIDATIAAATPSWIEQAVSLRKPLVVGTTGHPVGWEETLHEVAKQIPLLLLHHSCSMGTLRLFQMVQRCAELLPDLIEVTIHDVHHTSKLDAPSGTALMLARIIERALPRSVPVAISSERVGDVRGRHTICFRTPHEELTCQHDTLSRQAFGEGALRGARWLIRQPPGLYTWEHLV